MNSLGIRKSDIKGPLDCLQPHSYTNLIYPYKKATIWYSVIGEQLFATKDFRRNIGSFSTNAPAMFKKAQNLYFWF